MPMAPQEELRPDHRMIGVVFASPQGPYFMRFVGPEKTVDKNKKDFDKWLKGFKKASSKLSAIGAHRTPQIRSASTA